MSKIQLYMLVLTLACGTLATKELPLARTSLGDLRGAWRTSAGGKQYAAFTSVPYAKPPVGPLRFEVPKPLEKWQGVWDASSIPPSCIAFVHLLGDHSTEQVQGQEDCLYLNVFTPKLPSQDKKKTATLLPVVVYIHGGAFMFGGTSWYGAKLLADRDVILVTINYRLGPLGFLSLDDPVQPGNNGMRDQVMALQWIQDHISAFSGDPNSVTITGGSAGGASVHYHYLSPLSRGLFARGISLSGTSLCRWALSDHAKEKSIQLASSLGCPVDKGASKIMQCLKERPAERILDQVAQFQVWQYSPFSPFGPVVETAQGTSPAPFLPDWPVRLLQKGNFKRVPWMTGVTTAEGLYPAAAFVADKEELALLDRDFTRIVPHLLDFNFTIPLSKQKAVSNKIRQHYLDDQPVDENTVPQVIKMISDRLFVVDGQRAAELQAKYSPVYFYRFAFRGKHSLSELMSGTDKDFGVSHADDVNYVLNVTFIKDEVRSGMEKHVETLMLNVWTSFIKTGIPQIDDVTWNPVSEGGDLEMLHIDGVPPSMVNVADLGDAKFWESLPLQEPQQTVVSSHDEL